MPSHHSSTGVLLREHIKVSFNFAGIRGACISDNQIQVS